jgi:hypothetical protein
MEIASKEFMTNMNYFDSYFLLAIDAGQIEIMKFLMSRSEFSNIPDNAIKNAIIYERIDIMQFLISSCNVNVEMHNIARAASYSKVEVMLSQ